MLNTLNDANKKVASQYKRQVVSNDFETVDYPTDLNSSSHGEFHEPGFTKSSLDKFNHSRIVVDIDLLQHVLRRSDSSHFDSNEHDLQRKFPLNGLGSDGLFVCRFSFQC